jgi:hypothetical protein
MFDNSTNINKRTTISLSSVFGNFVITLIYSQFLNNVIIIKTKFILPKT